MADTLSGFERQRLGTFMRGPMEKTPAFLHPDVAQMLRDVRGLYYPGETRPVGATPAMQSAVQGQPLPAAGEPVRPAPAMRTLAQGVGPRVQAPGYSGMGWSAPTATEVPGLGPQSATPDLTTRYSSPIGATRPPPPVGEIAQKMQDPRGQLSDMIRKMGATPPTATAAEDAGMLQKLAGAAGTIGNIASRGVMPTLGTALRATPVAAAYNVAQAARDPESAISKEWAGTYERVRSAPTLGEATGQMVGSTPRMLTAAATDAVGPLRGFFRGVMGGATGSVIPATAAAQPTNIPREALSPQPMAGAPQFAPAGARAQAPEEPQTVRIHRGGSGGGLTTTYDVSPGAPLGKVLSVEGMAPGLTPEEHLYNQQALRSAKIAAGQQEYSARMLHNLFDKPRPINQATAQMVAALQGIAGPGVAPVRPQMTKPIKAPTAGDDVTRAGYAMSQQIDQTENDFASRVQALQAANPQMSPEQIAADPQIRQNRLRKQRLQEQFNRMIELTSKRLPTLDQSMAAREQSGE